MKDDDTRTLQTFGVLKDDKTRGPKRLSVKLSNNKVYGPYLREEIFEFIVAEGLNIVSLIDDDGQLRR